MKRFALLVFWPVLAFANFNEFKAVPVDTNLQAAVRRAAEGSLRAFPKLTEENLAISVIDVTDRAAMRRADFRGDAPFYPASVIKLAFMLETYHQHKENDPDVPRALKEMIVESDNDATAYIIDTISGTASGPELSGWHLRRFLEKRRVANRYLNPMGYDVSAMAKPWSFGPYGRDVQLMGGPKRPNRNRATANAFASMVLWIVRERAVSSDASRAMLAWMERPLNPQRKGENQVAEFIGAALPPEAKLWSKAGWTSEVRHDAAYIELPSGKKWVVVIHTRGVADDVTLVPSIMRILLPDLQ
jgi:beta-lactamase class A